MEAEKFHDLSARWRTRKANGETQSRSMAYKLESFWGVSSSKSEGLRTRSSDVWGLEKMNVPAQAEKANIPSAFLFCSGSQWMGAAHLNW